MLKFVFFENKQELVEQLRVHMNENIDNKQKKDININQIFKKKDYNKMPFFKSQTFFLGRKELGNNFFFVRF